MDMVRYTVRVADNFHYADESETYTLGTFDTVDEALLRCKAIVDDFLATGHVPGMSAESLYQHYITFGDDPFIVGQTSDERFSAWDYARQRCDAIARTNALPPVARIPVTQKEQSMPATDNGHRVEPRHLAVTVGVFLSLGLLALCLVVSGVLGPR
ncbi:hypothetical protein FIV34_11690 [Luteibacter pinisoli]|uniref:Uncharacterized protein n=1 Tax=Luteibacter pinisoli TaxID=2589080 RepID=A0A4Y5Z653_9GAMM|nr:hypothetical protein [Luteibacter pinisoli]QDE39823.1 hypothetical protein FIV34_11690 [Luteibacter pinisoli]